jgi:hypothetical protein
MMNKRFLFALPLLVVLCGTGCLEFERQTVFYRHDVSTDTLYIFQDYQGIFGSSAVTPLTGEEVSQMTSVMRGGRTFFFGNWITEFNRESLEEARQTPAGELDDDPAIEKSGRAIIQSALDNVTVENVGFYFNGAKQLCGAQRVKITHVSKVLADLNRLLPHLARTQAEEEDKSEEEKKLLIKFADSGQNVLQLKGNQMTVRWPLPLAEYRRIKDRSSRGAAFQKSGGVLKYQDDVMICIQGKPDSKMESLTLQVSGNPYSDNAVEEAGKHGIKESFDAAGAARDYLLSKVPGKKD